MICATSESSFLGHMNTARNSDIDFKQYLLSSMTNDDWNNIL